MLFDRDKITEGMKVANREMVAAVETESVIVLGPTRAGKSTICCMMSGLYTMCKSNEGMESYISANTGREDLVISAKMESQTTFPAKVETKDGSCKYWDTPGSEDTKGVEQEILNAYYIKRLVDNHRSVKTVLVIALHQLQGDGMKFIKGVAIALEMFDSVPDFMRHLTLVVTGTEKNATANDVRNHLQNKLIQSTNLQHPKINEVKEYCKNVIAGKCEVVVMEKPQFADGQRGKDVPMKPEEYAKFIEDMKAALNRTPPIHNLQRINVVVSPEATEALKACVEQQIKAVAKSFRILIKKVKDFEQGHGLANLTSDEESIVKGLKRLKDFDLFQWLLRFRSKNEQLSLLAKTSDWEPKLVFPKEVMAALGSTSTEIANEIGMIVFFYGILKENEQATLPAKLFEELAEDMKKLEKFYEEQNNNLEALAMQALKAKLCDSAERHFSEFLENTMSNSAALVTDLNSELVTAAASNDIAGLVRKLQSTEILGAECLGKDEYAKLQGGFKSALTILKTFPDASRIRIDQEFIQTCRTLLQRFCLLSASCQEQASVAYQSFDASRLEKPQVHCFKKSWDDLEAMQNENSQLQKQIEDYKTQLSALQDTDAHVHLKRIEALKEENQKHMSEVDTARASLEETTKANEGLKFKATNFESLINDQHNQILTFQLLIEEQKTKILELEKQCEEYQQIIDTKGKGKKCCTLQ